MTNTAPDYPLSRWGFSTADGSQCRLRVDAKGVLWIWTGSADDNDYLSSWRLQTGAAREFVVAGGGVVEIFVEQGQ